MCTCSSQQKQHKHQNCWTVGIIPDLLQLLDSYEYGRFSISLVPIHTSPERNTDIKYKHPDIKSESVSTREEAYRPRGENLPRNETQQYHRTRCNRNLESAYHTDPSPQKFANASTAPRQQVHVRKPGRTCPSLPFLPHLKFVPISLETPIHKPTHGTAPVRS